MIHFSLFFLYAHMASRIIWYPKIKV